MKDLVYLKKLLGIFDASSAVELTVEEEGSKIHIAKATSQSGVQFAPQMLHSLPESHGLHLQQPPSTIAIEPSASVGPTNHIILSPIVGTFYRASSPDADNFCQVGSRVSTGQPLCIIEAMKLMNEIESDATGTVVKVFVENHQPVEYNQPLFEIQLG